MTSKHKSIIKYLLAATLLGLLLHNTDISKIAGYFRQISPVNIIAALCFVTCAQVIAALRMRYFFRASGFHLSRKFAIVLYYVGAFYNFLLPGGIGGDAYKVMIARKRMEMKTTLGIKLMIADRASGLCILMFILFAALYRIDISKVIPHANFLLALATIITLVAYLVISRIALQQLPRTMLASLPYSFVSQSLWVLTLYSIWQSLGSGKYFLEYTGLYAGASIASMLPVSVGGLGIREMAYFYGASLFQRYASIPVDGNLGVVLSLCIFALTFLAALPGILWLHKVTHLHHQ